MGGADLRRARGDDPPIAHEFIDHARVGETIEIDGKVLPFRPVAVSLGKTVNNGWGGYECCWARTMLAALVGGLEVPGGTLGTTVRLNRPHVGAARERAAGARRLHGLSRSTRPTRRTGRRSRTSATRTGRMVPLAGNGPWSQALGPTHFSWMFLRRDAARACRA